MGITVITKHNYNDDSTSSSLLLLLLLLLPLLLLFFQKEIGLLKHKNIESN